MKDDPIFKKLYLDFQEKTSGNKNKAFWIARAVYMKQAKRLTPITPLTSSFKPIFNIQALANNNNLEYIHKLANL